MICGIGLLTTRFVSDKVQRLGLAGGWRRVRDSTFALKSLAWSRMGRRRFRFDKNLDRSGGALLGRGGSGHRVAEKGR